jgi:hypothetical protein
MCKFCPSRHTLGGIPLPSCKCSCELDKLKGKKLRKAPIWFGDRDTIIAVCSDCGHNLFFNFTAVKYEGLRKHHLGGLARYLEWANNQDLIQPTIAVQLIRKLFPPKEAEKYIKELKY